jgi:pimeloyl-ACP methyl ester carboxylesterase
MRGKFLIGVIAPSIAVLFFAALGARGDDIPVQPQRTLVVVIHGTEILGGPGSWLKVVPGMATFASEVQRGAGPGSEIYSFFWSGRDDDPAREQAARKLAEIIDEKAASFDRICLVGHSHGGNVALLAAGMCHHEIDTVVCLATPHFYLETTSRDRAKLLLPVDCTWQARSNIKSVINIFTRFDAVPTFWAELTKHLSIRTAISLTRTWEDHLAFGHLGKDMSEYLMGQAVVGIPTFLTLNVADVNQPVESLMPSTLLDWHRHSAIHSLRMGYVVGELLRDGPTRQRMAYIATTVQPTDADEGEPVSEQTNMVWNQQHSEDFRQVGWRLDKVSVRMDPAVKLVTGPREVVSVNVSADQFPFAWHAYPSPVSKETLDPTWTTNFILAEGQSGVVNIRDGIRGRSLGSFHFAAADHPPSSSNEDVAHGIYWSADLQWTPVHY